MSKQTEQSLTSPSRPSDENREAWASYWQQMGQSWRTEPEISPERQAYLAERRSIVPNMVEGIYPFKHVEPKLSRADVEWLLASHENGDGPVDWQDEHQRGRPGLDLRAADLRGVDLRKLPLARLHGGLTLKERKSTNEEQWMAAGVIMEEANLREAQLQGATLCNARLQGAILRHAYLQYATLIGADLQHTGLSSAKLQGTNLRHTQLQGAFLADAELGDEQQVGPYLADAHLENANLAVLGWSQITILADEHEAQQKQRDGKVKATTTRLEEYRVAVRANRQLAIALQTQGLNEEASRFVYRAQCLERRVFWFQMLQSEAALNHRMQSGGAWLFSWLLDLIAGYGYRPQRCLVLYVLALIGFTLAHYIVGVVAGPHLTLLNALAVSVQSLHGRIFSFQAGDPQTLLNTIEAFVGLFIEAIVVAVITQRILGK